MLTLYSADSKINQKQFYATSGIYAICYEEKNYLHWAKSTNRKKNSKPYE